MTIALLNYAFGYCHQPRKPDTIAKWMVNPEDVGRWNQKCTLQF